MISLRPLLAGLHMAALVVASATCSTSDADSHKPTPGNIRWFGGPTVTLERGGLRIMTDPMLGARGANAFVLPKHPSTGAPNATIARYTEPPSANLGQLDAILLSHGHADHFDARAKERLGKSTLVIAPPNMEASLRAADFTQIVTLDWGRSTKLARGAVTLKITAVPAHHAHDPALDAELGKGNGYVLVWDGGPDRYVAYWTGDSVLTDEMGSLPGTFGPIDLMIAHAGAVGVDGPLGKRTMDADEIVRAMALIAPRRTIPTHHTTFGHYREPVRALEEQIEAAGLGKQLTVLREGESAPLD